VVVGKIISIEKHPDADKLQVTKVDIGSEAIQVVTGARNISLGDYIPVALVGARLPGDKKISKGKLRGVESCGMMCSIQELNLTKEDYPNAAEDGIFILEDEPPLGKDIKEVLGINETVVDFEITSNRPDCLSIVGIARESAVTLGSTFKMPEIKVKEEADDVKNYATVEISDPDLCPRYAARIVKEVKIEPSPKWMRDKLKAAGVRPINNIVDITNYVMLELGQPMHAFDLNNLNGSKIIVRRAKDGEVMHTLDDQERKLDSSMLVIADADRPVAVAGVMGGANSEVTGNTGTILFESANFDGISVRRTAKKIGLRTEASARFEKGLDVENVMTALQRAVQLVEELGAGKVCKGVIDCYPKKSQKKTLPLRPDKINALLGTSIDTQYMLKLFKELEFGVDESSMMLTVPSFRPDVEREADLAEEVARFYDYNNIKATLLSGKEATQGRKTFKQKVEDIIKTTMISCGLSETYTYSFTSPKVWDKINLPKDSDFRKAVVITNPLGEDYSVMRTTTMPEMLEVISTNYNRRVEEAGFFEMSLVIPA
jgi:phenylalanyl-tRNA synthetase beta chain